MEYILPSVEDDGCFHFTIMQLETGDDDDMRIMFSIFNRCHSLRPIELNASLIRHVDVLCSSWILPKTLYEIVLCMFDPEKKVTNLYDQ